MTMISLGTLCHCAFAQNLGLLMVDRAGLGMTRSSTVLKWYALEFAKKCLSAIEVTNDAECGAITKDLALMVRYSPVQVKISFA